jgi:NTE family protein
VVSIPGELMKDGKFALNRDNIAFLRNMRDDIIRHGGMDTAPLRKIIEDHMDEKKIRRSGVDFGMVAYEITGWKPHEIFMKDIPSGMMTDYLLATSAFPGFKAAKVKEKQFIDGGLYDNIPFALAKRRGYRRIIIVDVSGIGVNRKPEVQGTETIYIKNSIDMGAVFDFSQEFIQNYMRLGYLDTMKVFGRNYGIHFFYNYDQGLLRKLDSVILSDKAFDEYRHFIEPESFRAGKETAVTRLRQLLPEDMKSHRSLATVLVEYGALAVNLERNREYRYRQFVKNVWNKLDGNSFGWLSHIPGLNKGFFDPFAGKSRENALIPLKVLRTVLKHYYRKER